MLKEYFRILKKIPKAHFGIYIILFVGSLLATQFITNEEKNINYERLYYGLIGFAILIPIWVQIQWTRFALKELLLPKPVITNKVVPQLRHLSYSIALPNFIENKISMEISVTRRWYPDVGMPTASHFIREISIENCLCSACNSDYILGYDRIFKSGYICSNQECKNKSAIPVNDWDSLRKSLILKLKNDIRNNMEKYWKSYKDEYMRVTNNHPELYDRPSTTYVSSYI